MSVPHVIYVIVGQCHAFGDTEQWLACWRATEEEAKGVVAVLNAQAVEARRLYDIGDDYKAFAEYRGSMLDPGHCSDHAGATYSYEAVADDARALEVEEAGAR